MLFNKMAALKYIPFSTNLDLLLKMLSLTRAGNMKPKKIHSIFLSLKIKY